MSLYKGRGVDLGHTLIVINYISQMVPATVMSFAHTHRIVGQVDIAVIALLVRRCN